VRAGLHLDWQALSTGRLLVESRGEWLRLAREARRDELVLLWQAVPVSVKDAMQRDLPDDYGYRAMADRLVVPRVAQEVA
jgi:hypothetical protein